MPVLTKSVLVHRRDAENAKGRWIFLSVRWVFSGSTESNKKLILSVLRVSAVNCFQKAKFYSNPVSLLILQKQPDIADFLVDPD
jgi:hypothetical protein